MIWKYIKSIYDWLRSLFVLDIIQVSFKEKVVNPKDPHDYITKKYWGYNKNGIFNQHRIDGPSCVFLDKQDNVIFECYCIHGKYRKASPYYVEYKDGNVTFSK